MKFLPALCITCCFIFFSALTATAQFTSMATKAPWLQYFFAKMSPNTPEFSAMGQIDLCDPSGTAQLEMPMNLAATTNAFRWDTDVSQISPMPSQVKTMSKQLRIDKMAFLIRKDEQKLYILYPNLLAYVQAPIPPDALAQFAASSDLIKLQKTQLGQESVGGHPCIKNKVTDTEPNLPQQTGLEWDATDLQGFPIKMELRAPQGLMRFDFQEVTTNDPGAWPFQVPANYTFFKSTADVMTYAKRQALLHNAE